MTIHIIWVLAIFLAIWIGRAISGHKRMKQAADTGAIVCAKMRHEAGMPIQKGGMVTVFVFDDRVEFYHKDEVKQILSRKDIKNVSIKTLAEIEQMQGIKKKQKLFPSPLEMLTDAHRRKESTSYMCITFMEEATDYMAVFNASLNKEATAILDELRNIY